MARAQSFASDVTAGYFASGSSVWVPASQTPVSVPFSFGVLWNGAWAPNAAFYITPPNGMPLSPQGATSHAVAWDQLGNPTRWVLMNNGVIPGPHYRNGTWTVRVEVETMPGIPPSIPPTVVSKQADIDVAHLWVSSLQWSTSVPGATVSNAGPFVAVSTESGSPTNATYALAVGDGYEPAAPELVNQTIQLHTLPSGPTWSGVGPVPPAPALYTGTAYSLLPGLYSAQVLLSDGLGGVDSTEYLSRYLSVSALMKTAFEVGGARQGKLCFSVTTTDTGVHPITEKCYVVRRPDGTLLQPGGTAPSWSGGTTACNLNTLTWPYAGTYVVGLSYKDSEHEHLYHDNQPRWSHVGSTTIEIPASAHFYDSADPVLGSTFGAQASWIEGLLGAMPPGAPTTSFYAPRYPVGTRGGVVAGPPLATVLDSLQEDQVVSINAHGWHTSVTLNTQPSVLLNLADIDALPAGALSQLRLIALHCCAALPSPSVSDSVGAAMFRKGAKAVWGYKYYRHQGGGTRYFEDRVWSLLADGYGLHAAITQAKLDTTAQGYSLVRELLDDDPNTPQEEGVSWLGPNQTIAPAFTIP